MRRLLRADFLKWFYPGMHIKRWLALMIIGVGDHCEVDQIEVRWPDTKHSGDRFDDVRANYVLKVRPGHTLPYQPLEHDAQR